jgi:riboflavin biosynthesis pyrimidine reductase
MHQLLPSADYHDALEPYAAVTRRARPTRPWVLANMVCGIDGSTAVSGRVGPLSSPADAALFKRLRSLADVVLVGASTVRQERYGPVRLADDLRDTRTAAGRPPVPPIAVVTRSIGFDWSTPLFAAGEGPRPIVVTCDAAGDAAIADAERHAEVLIAGTDRVEVERALELLGERGHQVVLCEGGATLLGELAAGDLLDELCLTISPLMGGDSLPVARASDAPSLRAFGLAHVGREGDALFLRYERGMSGR